MFIFPHCDSPTLAKICGSRWPNYLAWQHLLAGHLALRIYGQSAYIWGLNLLCQTAPLAPLAYLEAWSRFLIENPVYHGFMGKLAHPMVTLVFHFTSWSTGVLPSPLLNWIWHVFLPQFHYPTFSSRVCVHWKWHATFITLKEYWWSML